MASVNVSLPAPIHDWVEEKVRSGEYGSASEYLAELVRYDRERRLALVEALIEGENSGLSQRSVDDIIADAKARIRHEAR